MQKIWVGLTQEEIQNTFQEKIGSQNSLTTDEIKDLMAHVFLANNYAITLKVAEILNNLEDRNQKLLNRIASLEQRS